MKENVLAQIVARKPVLLVVSGPSGSGKDSVIAALRNVEPNIAYVVSATTRPPRPGEVEGEHYRFLDRDQFEKLAAAGEFIETREYAGNLYGTPRRFVDEAVRSGRDVVLKPEVNGARAVKAAYPQAVLVFLTAPSDDALAQRLERRNTDTADAIAVRLETARREAGHAKDYDYLIVNDELDKAVSRLSAILTAEGLRVSRL
jgi:guanylate kinase